MLGFFDRVNIFFNKGKLMLINIYTPEKRKKTYVCKRSDSFIMIGEKAYTVDPKLIYLENGMPTLTYMEDNTLPVNYLDEENVLSAGIVKSALEENISKKIMNYAKDDDKELLRKVMLIMGLSLLIMAVGFFFIYDQIQVILENLPDNVPNTGGVISG